MSALNSYSSTVNSGSKVSATLGMSAGSATVAPSRLSSAMAASATASASGLIPHTPSRHPPTPGPARAGGVEEAAVGGVAGAGGGGGGRVAGVDPGHGAEHGG